MTKGFERAWVYGQYKTYWQYNFDTDESTNANEAYEQIIAETMSLA